MFSIFPTILGELEFAYKNNLHPAQGQIHILVHVLRCATCTYFHSCCSIDATNVSQSNLCRYVNEKRHSLANASMRSVKVDGKTCACLFATQHIPVGTEIRYAYIHGPGGKTLPWRAK